MPSRYAVLGGTELPRLQPASEKTIHLEHFLDPTPVARSFLPGGALVGILATARRPFVALDRLSGAAGGHSAVSSSPADGRPPLPGLSIKSCWWPSSTILPYAEAWRSVLTRSSGWWSARPPRTAQAPKTCERLWASAAWLASLKPALLRTLGVPKCS